MKPADTNYGRLLEQTANREYFGIAKNLCIKV